MKVEFCLLDSGDVVFTKDSKDLNDVLNVITKVGTEIHLSFSEDDFIHGYVQNVMYAVDAENNKESLKVYFSNDYSKSKHHPRLSPEHLETVRIQDKN
ncbi:hypothetical protein [uncultured Clostridium sp.]|uniref:hypothetical protein n=1 Tax=uncultured Clostridium sp. TaxID=59620 RepID=UPI0025DEC351|nr:hypothetical protein [uncultured Clostridium sp.]